MMIHAESVNRRERAAAPGWRVVLERIGIAMAVPAVLLLCAPLLGR